jgi:hypothetical protein
LSARDHISVPLDRKQVGSWIYIAQREPAVRVGDRADAAPLIVPEDYDGLRDAVARFPVNDDSRDGSSLGWLRRSPLTRDRPSNTQQG